MYKYMPENGYKELSVYQKMVDVFYESYVLGKLEELISKVMRRFHQGILQLDD